MSRRKNMTDRQMDDDFAGDGGAAAIVSGLLLVVVVVLGLLYYLNTRSVDTNTIDVQPPRLSAGSVPA
jgi:hypothetical protein